MKNKLYVPTFMRSLKREILKNHALLLAYIILKTYLQNFRFVDPKVWSEGYDFFFNFSIPIAN